MAASVYAIELEHDLEWGCMEMNDKFNIAQRQKLAKQMNVTEEKAAEFMTMMQMCQVKPLKDIMEHLNFETRKMKSDMVKSGMPDQMAQIVTTGMAMSVALSVIETIALKDSSDASGLAKKIMKLVDSSSAVTIKLEEDDIECRRHA